jgi:glycosyltransferase involved in cell wall biosynthesis
MNLPKRSKKHVVFLFEGVPHYFSTILDGINREFRVSVIQAKTVSYKKEGIKASEEGSFNRYYLEKYQNVLKKDFFRGFKKLLIEIQPDVLVVNWPHWLQFLLSPRLYYYLKESKVKLVLKEIPFCVPRLNQSYKQFISKAPKTVLHLPVFQSIWRFIFQKVSRYIFYRMVDGILNYTDSKILYDSYGLDNKHIFTTFNSHQSRANLDIIESIGYANKTGFEIVHVGRLVWWKRVDLLITASKLLKEDVPELRVHVIGDGPELENLKKQATELGLEDVIVFHGSIYDPKEMARILLKSSVYVLAGMGGLSINEAMSHGLPIICSVCDGTEKDLVQDGINGYYFKDNDPEDLKTKIQDLLLDEDKLEQFGLASLNIIKNQINEEIVAKNYIHAFNKILSSS